MTGIGKAAAVFAIILGLWNSTAQADDRRPIIFIPGMVGSKLCDRTTGEVVWGEGSLSRFKELALPANFDPEHLKHKPCGLVETIEVLGPFRFHFYDGLLKLFSALGYTEGKNLHIFSYDWRLSNTYNAMKLNEFIAQKVPEGQFDIISHSMGGIIAKLWLAQYGESSRVNWVVSMGTPYLGTASSLKIFDQGWGFWANYMAGGLKSIRETALTFPSVYELLPSYPNCCAFQTRKHKLAYFDPFDSKNWNLFGWLPKRFKSEKRKQWLAKVLERARTVAHSKVPDRIHLIPIANSLIDTAWRVIYDRSKGDVLRYLPHPGDGTVTALSATNGNPINGRPSRLEHARLFDDEAARQVLRWVIRGGEEPTAGTLRVAARLRTAKNAEINVTSLDYGLDPPVAKPSAKAKFIVEIRGDPALAKADLSNLTAHLADSGNLPARVQEAGGNSVEGYQRIAFQLKAPAKQGAYEIFVHIPNVADLSDVGLVVEK